MSRDFYDTSSFAKLFLREKGSEAVLRKFRTASEVVVSTLTFVEMRSAVQKLVNRKIVSQVAADAIHNTIDQTTTEVTVVSVREEDFAQAEKLVRTRTLRALDALQLATALTAAAEGDMTFIVSDAKLREAAIAEGLPVFDPS